MSRLNTGILLFVCACAVVAGCSNGKDGLIFTPGIGHPDAWVGAHGAAAGNAERDCSECHGDDLMGGISAVSCFAPSLGGVRCHGSGPGTSHGDGWEGAGAHGATAKNAPGGSAGFSVCKECHGNDYGGGITEIACETCHGVPAPHPARPWRGRPYTHTNTNSRNAAVCADCHRERAGNPSCFNTTLCHGDRNVHPSNWASPSVHGADAKKNPGNSGFAECKRCHGRDFSGGESDRSCFPCHGLDAPHPANGWLGGGPSHTTTGEFNANVCADCHRENPGSPGCFNGTLCHGNVSPHDAGWSSPSQHGAAAKEAPGADTGFASCSTSRCHGTFFGGGDLGPNCFSCHSIAPHPNPPWRNGTTHTTTHPDNIDVCARCHASVLADPPSCFIGNACHGAAVKP